jgi:hypothetical protein
LMRWEWKSTTFNLIDCMTLSKRLRFRFFS